MGSQVVSRVPKLALVLSLCWVGAGLLAFAACASDTGAPSGTQCFSAIDCAAGLACIPKGQIYVCSSNVTSIESMIDAGMDVMSKDGGALPSFDTGAGTGTGAGSTPDTGGTTPTPDAGSPG